MNEWQPARTRNIHSRAGQHISEALDAFKGKVVRVRPSYVIPELADWFKEAYVSSGCTIDAKWYEIHPDDVRSIFAWAGSMIVCEHEILTD